MDVRRLPGTRALCQALDRSDFPKAAQHTSNQHGKGACVSQVIDLEMPQTPDQCSSSHAAKEHEHERKAFS